MAKEWNLAQLRDELQWVYNFNEGQTDQDMRGPAAYVNKWFDSSLNEAYVDEVEEAVQMGCTTCFITTARKTWPVNTPTFDIGDDLAGSTLYRIESRDAGAGETTSWEPMWINTWTEDSNHVWVDRRTIQWGLSGPASAQTIRFTYVAEPEELADDMDVPVLIPRKFRHLLVYSAAIRLRIVADDEKNQPLVWKRNEIRERLHKAISQGRPAQTGYPGTSTSTPDVYGLIP